MAEIAVALHCSQRTAGNLVGIGIALAGRLPATDRAFTAGDIDLARVRVIGERTQHVSDERLAVIEAAAVDRARTSNPATLGPKIDRIILAREPDAVFQRRRAATVEREVVITSIADGMVEIWGRLPGQDGVLLDSRLDQVARTVCPADPRSHAARRADALTCLVTDTAMTCGCGCQGSTPLPAHRRPQVIVSAATLLGVTQDPAELVGYGPIDPDLAGELAADADWVRALTDAGSGALTELRPHTYTPGAAVARLVRLRDRTCRFPGCTIPARRCDLDHREPLDHRNPASGGTTTPDNLFALCRYHHRAKTLGVWTYTHAGGAVVEWTSPTGSTHTTWPPDYGGSSPPEDDSPLR